MGCCVIFARFPGERKRKASVDSKKDSKGDIVVLGRGGQEQVEEVGHERQVEEDGTDAEEGNGERSRW